MTRVEVGGKFALYMSRTVLVSLEKISIRQQQQQKTPQEPDRKKCMKTRHSRKGKLKSVLKMLKLHHKRNEMKPIRKYNFPLFETVHKVWQNHRKISILVYFS